MNIKYYSKEEIIKASQKFIKPCNILVDVGCGIRPYLYSDSNIHVCIEPFKEYINIVKSVYKNLNLLFLNNYALDGLKQFPDNSVDTVIMIDLIEHLEKTDGYDLLKEADRIARRQILVFTPLGYLSNHREGNDAWGLNGQELQEHKSGWLPEDFGKDFEFHICKDFHTVNDLNMPDKKAHGCLWAIKNKNIEDKVDLKTPDFVLADFQFMKEEKINTLKEKFACIAQSYAKEVFFYKIKKFFIGLIPLKRIRKNKRDNFAKKLEILKIYYTNLAAGFEFENPDLITPSQKISGLINFIFNINITKLPLNSHFDVDFQRKLCCI